MSHEVHISSIITFRSEECSVSGLILKYMSGILGEIYFLYSTQFDVVSILKSPYLNNQATLNIIHKESLFQLFM